uniref:galactose-3-O-sulfotransferase 3-like isoform X1 n=1 Tax=Styela clava TaxID=7725 RepID=UPI00193A2A41|nr:galactose-3-O-sulfotransferase 3-like isoform X1 [Styela clava]
MGFEVKAIYIVIPAIFVVAYVWARNTMSPSLRNVQTYHDFIAPTSNYIKIEATPHTELEWKPTTVKTSSSSTTTLTTSKQQWNSLTQLYPVINKLLKRCSPHKKIVYVKTHKTASSSVFGILIKHLWMFRGKKQNMFPLSFIGGYPGHFDSKFLLNENKTQIGSSDIKPNVVAGHLRFNATAFKKLMPPGTKYITILRNPADAFYSAFNYYYGDLYYANLTRMKTNCRYSPYLDLLGRFNASFEQFLKTASTKLNPSVPWYFRGMNYQSHDLGMDPSVNDQGYISDQIRQLAETFDLVMISDYYLESLVLLKEELCLSKSILSRDITNKGKHGKRIFTKTEMSLIRSLHKQDYALYDYFNRTLWKKIDAYGRERMAEQIKKIQYSRISTKKKSRKHKEDFIPSEKLVESHYSLDTATKLATRLAKESGFDPHLPEIINMAEYMHSNSGGCNF